MEIFRREYQANGQKEFWLTVEREEQYIALAVKDEIRIALVLCGRMRLYTEGEWYDFSAGDVYSLNPGQFYSLQQLEGPCYTANLFFDKIARGKGQIDYWFGNRFTCHSGEATRNTAEYRFVRFYLAQMYDSFLQGAKVNLFELNGMMILLHAHLVKYFTAIENLPMIEPVKAEPEIYEVMRYTEEHFRKQLTLEEVSAIAGKNRSYFSTYFKKQMGYGWYSYLTRLRLRRGVELLNDTDRNLVDIALASGFCDSKAFFTAFKRFFALSPREYRRINRQRGTCSLPDDFDENTLRIIFSVYKKEGL